ncbi:MAG: tRNA-dihydrouridine synthase, partial [Myxococcota bacterium]|nr:tRNA-dihydrouridine synthase [Myxococcota bacterium]
QMSEVATVPVIGSGDILTADDALRRFRETGCDGVMIGRGAITNPWIFRQIAQELRGETVFQPTWRDKIDAVAYYRDLLLDHYPARVAPGRMKMMLSRLVKGMPDAASARLRCLRCPDPYEMLTILEAHCVEHGVLDQPASETESTSSNQAAA